MSKLGATLKNKRETLGLDIDRITEETRISEDIIDVLEKGEFKTMPSYNHAKNFVKNYATYLKLDLDKVQELFDDECTKEDFNREVKYVAAPVTKEKSDNSSVVKFVIPVVLVVVIAFLGFKVFMAMQKGEELKQSETTVKEEVKKDVDVQVDTPVDTKEVKEVIESINKEQPADTKPAEPKNTDKPTEAKKPAQPVKEEVKTDDSATLSAFLPEKKTEPMAEAKTAIVNFADVCWVHIKIDGDEEMDFIAEKGNQREVVFHDNFTMDIGNAAVVSISYNGRTIAGLGAYKQPVKGLTFTVNDSNRLVYTK